MKMKMFRILVVVALSLSVGALTGCARFKKAFGGGMQQEPTQLSSIDEQEGFADESSPNRMKAPYNQTYHFDLNKYDVHCEDVESINVQANYLVSHACARIRLEGNGDERGSREYNIALGWKRAKAVAAILKQQGVKDSQIAMVSYGKEKPIALGHDEDSHRLNRRVDLIYEVK